MFDTASPARLATTGEELRQRVRVFYTGNLNMEVAGHIRPGSYEADDRKTRRFFVMNEPQVRGLQLGEDDDLKLLEDLNYVILNKTRLSYVYDFNAV